MVWYEPVLWALGLVLAGGIVAGVVALLWTTIWCFRVYSVVASQLGDDAHVSPFNPLSGMTTIQALKHRPGEAIRHGERRFPFAIELGLPSIIPTKGGKPARFNSSDLRKIPAGAGREVMGNPSNVPIIYWFATSMRFSTTDPDMVKDILVTKARHFHKPESMKRFLGRLLGRSSLLLTDGDTHAIQRRIVSKAFAFELLAGMVPVFGDCAETAVRFLTSEGPGFDTPEAWLYKPSNKAVRMPPLKPDSDGMDTVPARFRDQPVVDASVAMSGLTLEIIAQSAFGGAFGARAEAEASGGPVVPGRSESAESVIASLEAGLADSVALISRAPVAFMLPMLAPYVPRPELTAFNRAKAKLDAFAEAVIAGRRAKPDAGRTDLLGLIVGASASAAEAAAGAGDGTDIEEVASGVSAMVSDPKDAAAPAGFRMRDSHVKLTDEEVKDQAVTFVMAGHETTSQLLTWTIYCLSQAPEWQARARAEAKAFLAGHADASAAFRGAEDLAARLPVVNAILQETMRLYAPASIVARTVVEDVTIGKEGLRIPAGMGIAIPIGAMHRDASVFVDPDDFDPCRWLDDDAVAALGMTRGDAGGLGPGDDPLRVARPQLKGLSPFRYMPFSAGPRNCVGQRFALLEARVAFAVMVARTEWVLDPQYRHAASMRITTQPLHGMPVRFLRA